MRSLLPLKLRGFTLLEILVVIAIVATLTGLAAPNMSQFLTKRQLEDVARKLGEDLAYSRNEAVKRNAVVLVCANTTGTCSATPTNTDWALGRRICFDVNADGTCDAAGASDPNPMRVQSAINPVVTLIGPTSRLAFNANGTITASNFTNFVATTSRLPGNTWTVSIAASGAVSVRKN